MRPAAALLIVGLAAAAPAAASAAELVVDGAMARVVVIPEARSDLLVDVVQARDPALTVQVQRSADRVRLASNLVARTCTGDSRGPEGWRRMRVRFTNGRWANMADAPVITIRAPRDLVVSGRGPVSGEIGALRNLNIRYTGCGTWRAGDVAGRFEAAASDGAAIRARNIGSGLLRAHSGGAVAIDTSRDLDVRASDGGAVSVDTASGRTRVAANGGGAVSIRGGRARQLDIDADGGAAVSYGGHAGAVNASADGGAVVSIASADGPVNRSSGGGALLSIGGRNR